MVNKILIKGKEYKIKSTLRAIFIFEHIAEKSFEIKTMLDNYLFLFSILLANNPDATLTWHDFIDALDEDSSIYEQINKILIESNKVDELFDAKETEGQNKETEKKNSE